MLVFDPLQGGQDIIQDTTPADGTGITFLPSIASDVLGAVPQIDSEVSATSFMQTQFRASAENMNSAGLLYSESI